MASPADPFRPVDDEARALARRLMTEARHGALAVRDGDGPPHMARVAVGWDGRPLLLMSDLALHARLLRADPLCGLLLGEPGRGDPLAHPRLSLQARAEPADKEPARDAWLRDHPKAALYWGFADFALWRLRPLGGLLNAGFGRAYRLAPADLGAP